MLHVRLENAHGGKDYPCWVTGNADEAKACGMRWSEAFLLYARPDCTDPLNTPPQWPSFVDGGVYRLSQSTVDGDLVSELVIAAADVNDWSFISPDEWLGDCETMYHADPTGLLVGPNVARTGFTTFDLKFTGQVLFTAWDDDHVLSGPDVAEMRAALSITSNALKVRRQQERTTLGPVRDVPGFGTE